MGEFADCAMLQWEYLLKYERDVLAQMTALDKIQVGIVIIIYVFLIFN